jgi:hypothetical protein
MDFFKKTLFVTALIASATQAHAGIVTNASELLSRGDHQLLSTMLGQDMDLTRVYAKQAIGNSSYHWHTAVDNQGPTFTVFEVINAGQETMRVGGYNDASWSGTGYADAANAFLFNLDTGIQYLQNGRNGTQHRIYKAGSAGPTFGGGHDLHVNSTLTGGSTNIGYTYGDKDGYSDSSYRNEFTGSYNSWTVGKMEAYTLSDSSGDFGAGATSSVYASSNAVADVSAPVAISAIALLGMMGFRRK